MIEEICLDGAKQILAGFLHLEIQVLETALQSLNEEQPYRKIVISKKNGSKRIVFCPKSQELKLVQKAILENILYKFPLDDNFFGFCKKRNIMQNARYHIRGGTNYNPELPTWILKIDIKDAFPSINTSMLVELFTDIFSETCLSNGLTMSGQDWYFGFLHLLLQFTTYNGVMIQGISTSPYLFNLYIQGTVNLDIKDFLSIGKIVFYKDLEGDKLGQEIFNGSPCLQELMIDCFIKNENFPDFKFSWYADDLVISFMNMKSMHGFKKVIIGIIESHGLKINKQKIRLTRVNRSHPLITGVVLNIKRYPTPAKSYNNCFVDDDGEYNYVGEYYNHTVTTRLKSKTIKSIRGKIHRAICIIKSGRLPDKEKDGISINTILGYIRFVKYMSRINNKKGSGLIIPCSLKKPMEEFQILIKEKYLR